MGDGSSSGSGGEDAGVGATGEATLDEFLASYSASVDEPMDTTIAADDVSASEPDATVEDAAFAADDAMETSASTDFEPSDVTAADEPEATTDEPVAGDAMLADTATSSDLDSASGEAWSSGSIDGDDDAEPADAIASADDAGVPADDAMAVAEDAVALVDDAVTAGENAEARVVDAMTSEDAVPSAEDAMVFADEPMASAEDAVVFADEPMASAADAMASQADLTAHPIEAEVGGEAEAVIVEVTSSIEVSESWIVATADFADGSGPEVEASGDDASSGLAEGSGPVVEAAAAEDPRADDAAELDESRERGADGDAMATMSAIDPLLAADPADPPAESSTE